MKIFTQVGIGALLAFAIASCWVDRRTGDFACTKDEDCVSFTPSRVCDTDIGYCVPGDNPGACPDVCNGGCDKDAKACAVNCTAASGCNDITCPDGYDCTITCTNNACDAITCNGGSECIINCVGANACGNVDCGDGSCAVTCNGANACNNVDCNDAPCDVTCVGSNACNDVDCDTSCRCEVACMLGTSCEGRSCSALQCETAQGCNPANAGCPSTCP